MELTLNLDKKNFWRICHHEAQIFQRPAPITVSQWSDKYRYLSSEASSYKGKWRSLPMQVEPMDAVLDPQTESICLMWASQTAGKTELILNIQAYHIDHDPAPQLILQPTVEMAETYSKDRLAPMVRDTPKLRDLIRDPRSRDSGNTILHKTFPGGHLTVIGANAPAGLASRPIRILLCDEVDRYPDSAGTEGDPILLAVKRTDTFSDSVVVMTSTPTIKDSSRIEREWNQSDKRYWFAKCPKCDHSQKLSFANLRWPAGHPDQAAYYCESCGAEWNDETRCRAIRAGQWKPTGEFTGKRGYHLSGLYTLFPAKRGFKSRMHQMAAQFIEAKHLGETSLQVWTNTFLAETWERRSTSVDAGDIISRAEIYGPVLPAGVLVLVCGVDVQTDRIEAEVVGYGDGDESWGVMNHIIYGNPELERTWLELDEFLLRQYEHASGHKLKVAACCIDAGFKTKQVYSFCRQRTMRRVFAVKGGAVPGAPLVTRPQRSSVHETLLFMVGTDVAKETIYSRLRILEPGPRYCHFPVSYGYNEEYYAQLTAEKCETNWERGKAKRSWVKKRERNEALDRRVYALAALDILNPDWLALKKVLDMAKPDSSYADDGSKAASKIRQQGPPKVGWVNSWRR